MVPHDQHDEQSKQFSNELRMDHDDALKKLNTQSLEKLKIAHQQQLSDQNYFKMKINSDHDEIKLEIIKGSIVDLPFHVDAIVNAANESLMGGGGIDQIIHARAGSELKEECKTKYSPSCSRAKGFTYGNDEMEYRCATGEAVITQSHNLSEKCQYIIHTVGPYLDENGNTQPELLSNCYKSCLQLAVENNLKSIAFPCISTGYYGYPIEEACRLALDTVKKVIQSHSNDQLPLRHVLFVIFNDLEFEVYKILFNAQKV